MTTFSLLVGAMWGFLTSRPAVPDKIEPQRTADVLPRRREITLKKARRIQRLRNIQKA